MVVLHKQKSGRILRLNGIVNNGRRTGHIVRGTFPSPPQWVSLESSQTTSQKMKWPDVLWEKGMSMNKILTVFSQKWWIILIARRWRIVGVTCNLVYKVKLKPKRFNIWVRDKDVPLSPGMAVTAEIKTGERRVIGFSSHPSLSMWMSR